MRKLFALFLLLAFNPVAAKETDTLRIYNLEEAMLVDPSTVLALDLSKMKLETLPPEIARFKNLRKLDISKNKITELPDFLSDFDSLETLDAHRNKLLNFPLALCGMANVKKLILSRNNFESIPECIQYMRSLAYLDLSDTPVIKFAESFVLMPHLKTLSLHGLTYPATFQIRMKEKLPWMRIEFDAPCNCME